MNPDPDTKPRLVMERMGRLEDDHRSFDIEFWQKMGPNEIFAAAWAMVHDAWLIKGRDVAELEFQGSVESFQRGRS